MPRIDIVIKESNLSIEKQVRKCIEEELNKHIVSQIESIKKAIKSGLLIKYRQDKTTNALIFGPLNAHFGFVAGRENYIVYKILETMINNIEYEFKPFRVSGSKFNGGLTIKILKEGFEDLLSLDVAETDNKGELLPWLDWLLNRGSSIIIQDFHISFSVRKNFAFSRSHQAIMVPNGTWRVPGEFSGTPRKNWLTKVLTSNIDYIKTVIEDIVMK